MSLLTTITYTLLVVTTGGSVTHSGGFESLSMCQEARG